MNKAVRAIVLLLVLAFLPAHAQNIELATARGVVCYGLDFSHARFIGTSHFNDARDLQGRLFEAWNDVIKSEPEKFEIPHFYKKEWVKHDYSPVNKLNAAIAINEVITDKTYRLEANRIEDIVKSYSLEKEDSESSIGLIYIVEALNHADEKATAYVTFFDIDSREVYLSIYAEGEPGGFGTRNYWINAMHIVMEESAKVYKKWLKGK